MTTTQKPENSIHRVWELLYRTHILQNKANLIFVTENDIAGFKLDPDDFLANLEFLEKLDHIELPHYDKPFRPGVITKDPQVFRRPGGFFKSHAGIDISLPKNFEVKYRKGELTTLRDAVASKLDQIKKLTLIGSKDMMKYKIVINDDYSKTIEVNKNNPNGTWAVLWAVANGEPKNGKLYKSRIDYLNTNKTCPLYTQTGYNLSQIVGTRAGLIAPKVRIEIRTTKTLAQRSKAT